MKRLISDNKHLFRWVSLDEGETLFPTLWNNSHRIFKFEGLDYYANDTAYELYLASDIQGMIADLVAFWKSEINGMYSKIKSKEIKMYRLHGISYPISKYLQSEYYSYVVSSSIGEEIRVIDNEYFFELDLRLSDFILFDSETLVIAEYISGEPKGDWLTKDKKMISLVHEAFCSAFEKAKDFHLMFSGDSRIEQSIIDEIYR